MMFYRHLLEVKTKNTKEGARISGFGEDNFLIFSRKVKTTENTYLHHVPDELT